MAQHQTRSGLRDATVCLGTALAMLLLVPSRFAAARDVRSDDMSIADGFRIEVAVSGLAAPTMVAFDDQGRMLIAESGYGGTGDARVSRVESDGSRQVLLKGAATEGPVTAVASHAIAFGLFGATLGAVVALAARRSNVRQARVVPLLDPSADPLGVSRG
jgi:hypothetical protein